MSILRLAAIIGTSALLGACAPSGYSLELSNHASEIVRVEVKAQKGSDAPTLAAASSLSPGQNITLFTQAERDAKVQAEARIQGDDKSPPAVQKLTLGLTTLVINPNTDAAKDASKPKLKFDQPR